MSANGKVVWSEGMFLRAQHFQQQDRYVERLVRARVDGIGPYPWGLREIGINNALLALGKFGLERCSGVFEDGTPIDIPGDQALPTPLDLPVGLADCLIYLCVPIQQAGGAEIDVGGGFGASTRFIASEQDVVDAISGANSNARIRTASLRLQLMLGTDDRSGFHCLGVARVAEVSADRRVRLDADYIPPYMDAMSSSVLNGYVSEVLAMLRHRGEALGRRVSGVSSQGTSEMFDFLMLQLLNRTEPLLAHFNHLPALHPERLYEAFLMLAGELATFTNPRRRPDDFAVYRHDDLENVFASVMIALRQSLSVVMEQSAVQIPLQDRKYGIRVGTIVDKTLIEKANFVLLVKASMPEEAIRRSLPALIKIGSVEQIRELVNVQLPGIRVQPLAVVPRQIPYHSGTVYFELESQSPIWKSLATSGGIAVHLAGEFPDVQMELWAIRR